MVNGIRLCSFAGLWHIPSCIRVFQIITAVVRYSITFKGANTYYTKPFDIDHFYTDCAFVTAANLKNKRSFCHKVGAVYRTCLAPLNRILWINSNIIGLDVSCVIIIGDVCVEAETRENVFERFWHENTRNSVYFYATFCRKHCIIYKCRFFLRYGSVGRIFESCINFSFYETETSSIADE